MVGPFDQERCVAVPELFAISEEVSVSALLRGG
jgi:hypothetical protein